MCHNCCGKPSLHWLVHQGPPHWPPQTPPHCQSCGSWRPGLHGCWADAIGWAGLEGSGKLAGGIHSKEGYILPLGKCSALSEALLKVESGISEHTLRSICPKVVFKMFTELLKSPNSTELVPTGGNYSLLEEALNFVTLQNKINIPHIHSSTGRMVYSYCLTTAPFVLVPHSRGMSSLACCSTPGQHHWDYQDLGLSNSTLEESQSWEAEKCLEWRGAPCSLTRAYIANWKLQTYHRQIFIHVSKQTGDLAMATTSMTSIFPYPQRMLAGKGRDHSSSLLGQPGCRLASAWCSTPSEFHQFHWKWWRLPPGIAYRLASDLRRMTWDSAVESTQSNETLGNKTMAYLSGLQYRIIPRNMNLLLR